jgi:hypothetical protein
MSDNWLRFTPTDPYYQPAEAAAEQVRALLRLFLPNADEITFEFSEQPVFVDAGGNWEGVSCPACGADAESWWGDAMSAAAEQDFASLAAVATCCGEQVSLNDLNYGSPVAFGRFVLDAMNPNCGGLSTDQLEQLGAAIGCPMREVHRRL